MKTNTHTSAKSAKSALTPRMKTGKSLLKSAQGDLRRAQTRLDNARAIRRAAA